MQQTWTLHVKGFGKIREAAITIKPMMFFIGKNNTGKSYLSMLLWGLLAHGQSLFQKVPPETPAYRACVRWVDDFLEQKQEQLSTEDCQLFIDWFNEVLNENKADFLKQIFNTENITINSISIENYVLSEPLPIIIKKLSPEGIRIEIKSCYAFQYTDKYTDLRIMSSKHALNYHIIHTIACNLLIMGLGIYSQEIDSFFRRSMPFFLPAARTGFMHNYKALVAEGMNQFGYNPEPKVIMPLPIIEFMKALATLSPAAKGTYVDIARWLETHVAQGIIEAREGAVLPEFSYIPAGSRERLPMHLSSSLVTELAPLVLFLKHYELQDRLLIIEEPEVHLHLEAQRYLARALARLVNRGVPVWLTTHGDTLAQQINNLIFFRNLPNSKDLQRESGYEDDELLAAEDVAAYEFEVDETGQTVVKALVQQTGGFPLASLSHTIVELSKESWALQEVEEDAEN